MSPGVKNSPPGYAFSPYGHSLSRRQRVFRIISDRDRLQSLENRVSAWIAPLEGPPDLVVRPFVGVKPDGVTVEVGVRFCSAPDDDFDRIVREVKMLADEEELARTLEPLRDRVVRQHELAVSILEALQEAVDS